MSTAFLARVCVAYLLDSPVDHDNTDAGEDQSGCTAGFLDVTHLYLAQDCS
jgi:hypothetical protein